MGNSGYQYVFMMFIMCAGVASAQDHIPKSGEFPPPNTGTYLAGELVAIDHVNRRGAIRLDGDFDDGRYHSAPSHQFAMLPYGSIRYHGAPAELRDIPIGTHLHGIFFLPPEDDKSLPAAPKNDKYVPAQNHAISIEDDFSFYERQGQMWTIKSIDLQAGTLHVMSTGEKTANGLSGEQLFSIDGATRIWKGRQFAEPGDLAANQTVQLNLTWSPGWSVRQFHVSDVWIDEESRKVAAERQKNIHIRHQHHRWLAGWVDQVEHQEGGRGIVTVTLFGGMDPSLYAEMAKDKGFHPKVAAAETTLRTWWQDHDGKAAQLLEVTQQENPPLGSSGIQLRLQFDELLEGFRPTRIVRVRCHHWPNVKLPPEERIKSMEERMQ